MNRTLLPLVLLASVACGGASTSTSPAPAPAPAPSPAPSPAKPTAHLWTVLPYDVTDGMEYGPVNVVLDESGKRQFVNLADLPEALGVSRLVRVEANGPMPDEHAGLQDFVWPQWKVVEVLAERREDPNRDWSAPVVSASVKSTPACVEVTVQVFESHTFCSTLPSQASQGALLFLEPSFYPFPAAGVPLAVEIVPELEPIKQPR